jgi:hypothetical protein
MWRQCPLLPTFIIPLSQSPTPATLGYSRYNSCSFDYIYMQSGLPYVEFI